MSKDIHKWTDGRYTLMFDEHTFFVWDNEKEREMTALEVTERLNKQQSIIKHLTIEKHQENKRFQTIIAELKEENDNCKNDYRELFSHYVALEEKNDILIWANGNTEIIEDVGRCKKRFVFNSSHVKKYHIRNVSPNGIVRLGNGHKAQWRIKDVRTIKNMLPPFEDFNAEIFQEIKNKFHTKFDSNVTGRIIYNIYNGTFDEWI